MIKKKNNEEKIEKKDNVKKKNKVISVIEYIIIFVIVFVNAILIFKTVNNPNKTPDLFGKKAFIIVSGSMIPTINIGDIVIINDTTNVKTNDIIAFREGGMVIVHRIINEEVDVTGKTMYKTKGDNNNVEDLNLVDTLDIEGLFMFKIPYLGNIILFLYKNLFLVVVIIIVIILFRYIKC